MHLETRINMIQVATTITSTSLVTLGSTMRHKTHGLASLLMESHGIMMEVGIKNSGM